MEQTFYLSDISANEHEVISAVFCLDGIESSWSWPSIRGLCLFRHTNRIFFSVLSDDALLLGLFDSLGRVLNAKQTFELGQQGKDLAVV